MKGLSVVVPCFNEEKNVERFPDELIKELDKLDLRYEVIAVDDGSTDGTLAGLMAMKRIFACLKVATHAGNKGLGAAIKTGIGQASFDLLVTLDADLTFHPRYIADLLRRFAQSGVDCVIGSPGLEGYPKSIPLYRRLISRIGTAMYNMTLSQRVHSPTTVFRLYKTEQLRQMNLTTAGFGINVEILAKLLGSQRVVAEVPVPLTNRLYGASSLNYPREIRRQLALVTRMALGRTEG